MMKMKKAMACIAVCAVLCSSVFGSTAMGAEDPVGPFYWIDPNGSSLKVQTSDEPPPYGSYTWVDSNGNVQTSAGNPVPTAPNNAPGFDPLTEPGHYRVTELATGEKETLKIVDGEFVDMVSTIGASFKTFEMSNTDDGGVYIDCVFYNLSENLHLWQVKSFYLSVYDSEGNEVLYAETTDDFEFDMEGTTLYMIGPGTHQSSEVEKPNAKLDDPDEFAFPSTIKCDYSFEYITTECPGANCRVCELYNPSRNSAEQYYVPETPSYTPSEPSYTPSTPSYTPSTPSYTPSTPSYTPSPITPTEKPAPKRVDCWRCTLGSCRACGGDGRTFELMFPDTDGHPCSDCGGSGRCAECDGKGYVMEE